jgi:hypothetical protein
MSHKYQPRPNASVQEALIEPVSIDVHPKEKERVAGLIAAGKSAQALDVAKDVHRRRHNPSSEALLLDAYDARLASLVERNLDREAKAVMDLVRERYPSAGDRLHEWNAIIALRHGDPGALLELLTHPGSPEGLPAEKQAAIAAQVRSHVLDLNALAECQTLAPEHPWRTAAAALHKAFEAVTSGPVADEALVLPEVSRHSPLAPWKMLVRAIAAFYRRDDALCQKCLSAIEPASAAARMAPALHALMHPPQTLTPATAALVNQAGGSLDQLRAVLKRLDSALDSRNQPSILQEVRSALAACGQEEPELLERLKQHISVRAMVAGAKTEKITSAMDRPPLRNAYFWRLLARGFEEDKGEPIAMAQACSAWEEFRKHAIREGWFPAQGPEAATLFLHMADLLHHVSPESLNAVRIRYERQFDGHVEYYRGQPAEIRALMPDRNQRRLYFLSTHEVLERACQAHPGTENFQRWLRHTAEASPDSCDLVAELWNAALPNDIPPLLHLMQSAEKRNALQKAFKYMERAEQIDGLNADVRRARLRLLVAMAVRHLREKKPKLAEKELLQIAALPQAQQGDRPAFVAALRFLWRQLRNEPQEAARERAEVLRILGAAVTAHLLLLNVENWCELLEFDLGKPPRPTVPLFEALGRVCALGDDMGLAAGLAPGMAEQVKSELYAPNIQADPRALAALGEAAMRRNDFRLAYAIAGAGLGQGADNHGRFLLLRSRSLPPWEAERRSSCLVAASELARRQHDSDLLNRISEWRDEVLDWLSAPEVAQAAVGSEEIGRVVRREMAARDYPETGPETRFGLGPASPFDSDEGDCPCPECCAERGELPQLPDLPPELLEMMEQIGPEAAAKVLAEMLGIGGKKKRGRRRPYPELNRGGAPF